MGIGKRELRKHVTDLHSRFKKQPAAQANLNEKFAVLHSLYKDFNILTRQKELLSPAERARALKIGVDEKYIDAPAEIIKEADEPPVIESRVNVSDETRATDSLLAPDQNTSILDTLTAKEREIRERGR